MKDRLLGIWMFLVLVSGGLDVAQMAGCASANPVAAAKDINQKAYALYGTFVVFEEQGAKVIADPTVAVPVKRAIQAADSKAKPAADALANALRQYEQAAAELKAGTGTAAQLTIATNHIGTWTREAQADIAALVSAVSAAKSTTAPPTTRIHDRAIPACDDSKPQVCLL